MKENLRYVVIILVLLITCFNINISGQEITYRIRSERSMIWDIENNKQISITDPVKSEILIVNDIGKDSMFLVSSKSRIGLHILPESLSKDPEGNQVSFIVDLKKGNYAQIIIKLNFKDWIENINLDSLNKATIYMSSCDIEGNPNPGKSGLLIRLFTIEDIILPK